MRAIKTGVIAASYLDPLAVRVQSIRMGANGRGWRRFLVFAALTKGRKGNEYVALFTYFSFEGRLALNPFPTHFLIRLSMAAHLLCRRSTSCHQCPYFVLGHASKSYTDWTTLR